MRSVVVVLPASMCAAIPIFLMRSSGKSRGMTRPPLSLKDDGTLPTVVGKGAIGLGHAVNLFLAAHGPARPSCCFDDFCRQAVHHGPLAAGPGRLHQPAQG